VGHVAFKQPSLPMIVRQSGSNILVSRGRGGNDGLRWWRRRSWGLRRPGKRKEPVGRL
jgi:hypothetical protein